MFFFTVRSLIPIYKFLYESECDTKPALEVDTSYLLLLSLFHNTAPWFSCFLPILAQIVFINFCSWFKIFCLNLQKLSLYFAEHIHYAGFVSII